ncbi:hypothetical protein B9479_007947 [Cryptococcus floricola]|uniref:Uncharacterized protein n=1 Tax=Cryptococcus floricola TaxID=2591691 RepID=A0A5D3AKH8_9TREE|nr:hypothetical protein B9479_007947 [Cryptococcus floricola]
MKQSDPVPSVPSTAYAALSSSLSNPSTHSSIPSPSNPSTLLPTLFTLPTSSGMVVTSWCRILTAKSSGYPFPTIHIPNPAHPNTIAVAIPNAFAPNNAPSPSPSPPSPSSPSFPSPSFLSRAPFLAFPKDSPVLLLKHQQSPEKRSFFPSVE